MSTGRTRSVATVKPTRPTPARPPGAAMIVDKLTTRIGIWRTGGLWALTAPLVALELRTTINGTLVDRWEARQRAAKKPRTWADRIVTAAHVHMHTPPMGSRGTGSLHFAVLAFFGDDAVAQARATFMLGIGSTTYVDQAVVSIERMALAEYLDQEARGLGRDAGTMSADAARRVIRPRAAAALRMEAFADVAQALREGKHHPS